MHCNLQREYGVIYLLRAGGETKSEGQKELFVNSLTELSPPLTMSLKC